MVNCAGAATKFIFVYKCKHRNNLCYATVYTYITPDIFICFYVFCSNHTFFTITNLSHANMWMFYSMSCAVRVKIYFLNIHQVCQHKNFALMRTQKLCLYDEWIEWVSDMCVYTYTHMHKHINLTADSTKLKFFKCLRSPAEHTSIHK